MTDLDTDCLAKNPADIQLRWMDMSNVSRLLLSDMADIVRELDPKNTLRNLEPIDVARGLVGIYDQVPPWVRRTQRLSRNARMVGRLLKQAKDPNRLIFDDIPQALSGCVNNPQEEATAKLSRKVRQGLIELQRAYPTMLNRLREMLLTELGVHNDSPEMLSDLRARAENVRQLSGDHRLEAFILRISVFMGTDADMESLASMALSKPPRLWTDSDSDRAAIELADLARSFVRLEAYAHVKGREDHRHAMAVVVGIGGQPIHDSFEVTDQEQSKVDVLIARVQNILSECGETEQNIILATLVRLSALHIETNSARDSQASKKVES